MWGTLLRGCGLHRTGNMGKFGGTEMKNEEYQESEKARLERIATPLLAGILACPGDFYQVTERMKTGIPLHESYAKEALYYAKALIIEVEKEGK